MKYSKEQLWERFQKYYTEFPDLGLALDISRMHFSDDYLKAMAPRMQQAFAAMAELEKGAIANPDENRMVGHYWLRNPALAPSPEIAREIQQTVAEIKAFAGQVHKGSLRGAKGPFKNLLLIGIGGSALGPQFVASALGHPTTDKMSLCFFDNTDPDGIDKVLAKLRPELGETLSVVVSKSGGTKETRNGMLEAQAAYKRADLDFGAHAVVVTSRNSELDKHAVQNHWLARFPMWDWVGGRTSQLSAVGLLPAALQGLDIDSLLAGAKTCDETTRIPEIARNPAAQMALMWYVSGNGKGTKNLIVLPYKDRLELFSRYLQQLVMESLGKELDFRGNVVHQGLTVFGNKGSTDQHAYVQQLRDGPDNFFVTFIEVLRDRKGPSIPVELNVTSGDYLNGFYQGTRQALFEKDRESITITLAEIDAFEVGVLIALFERTVGLYASLINVNAYHQPGVEAGKKAAGAVIALQLRILKLLAENRGQGFTAKEIAAQLALPDDAEQIFKICQHLAANSDRGVRKTAGGSPTEASFRMQPVA